MTISWYSVKCWPPLFWKVRKLGLLLPENFLWRTEIFSLLKSSCWNFKGMLPLRSYWMLALPSLMKLSSLIKKFHRWNCSLVFPSILCYMRTQHSFPLEEVVVRHHLESKKLWLPCNRNYQYLDRNMLVYTTVRNKSLFSREVLVSDVLLQGWEWTKTNRYYTIEPKGKMESRSWPADTIFSC